MDIAAFADDDRDDDVRLHVRQAMYEIIERAFGNSGIPLPMCRHEDRGDGVLIVVPPTVSAAALIDPLTDHLRAGLRSYNKMASEIAQLRLRMAVHAGYVSLDRYGLAGQALIRLFRLLHAPSLRTAFDTTTADLGLIVSDRLYDEVIRHGPGLIDPAVFTQIPVESKETRTRGWMYLSPIAARPALRRVPTMRSDAAGAGACDVT